MKLLKIGIRFWITLTSVLSFLTGWVMLAHAPKPNQATFSSSNVAAPLPTLEPLNPLSGSDDNNNFQNQPLFSVQPSVRSQFRPAFRTGGS
jgi:hypothetical protein